jgi:hypothetical protein
MDDRSSSLTTFWVLDIFHPETEELLVSIRLTPEQREALRPLVDDEPGEQELTVFMGERQT